MPWVPRIAPKEEVDAEDASKQKDALKGANSAASRHDSAAESAARDKALSCLVTRGADLWLDLQSRKLPGKKMNKFLTDALYDEIRKQLQNPKKPDRRCWYFNIDVSGTEMNADGLQILVTFLKRLFEADPPVCVHSLRCYNNDLGDTGAEHIAEMILAQPFAVYELHLSDSRMSELGAAMVILSVCVATDRYPFQVKHRWTGCWMRLENNYVSAPDALLTAMRAAMPSNEWSEPAVRIESIVRGDRTWGRAHGPSWATSAEVTPQALLYTFDEQKGVMSAGYGKKESAAVIRAARRSAESAREAVLEMHKRICGDDTPEGEPMPARVRQPEDRVVVARWRRDGDEGAAEAERAPAWQSQTRERAERAPKVSDIRSFRTAVNSLRPQAEPRETAASAQTAGKAGYTKFGPLGHGPAHKPTREVHDSHEYAYALGSGFGKGASPAKGTAAKGKLNVVHPSEEEEHPATSKTPAGKGDVQKGKQRSKDAKGSGKLVWKSKTEKPAAVADADAPSEEQKRQEAALKGDTSKANSSKDGADTAPAQDATKNSKSSEDAKDPKQEKPDGKDAKDTKEAKDPKGGKDVTEGKHAKEGMVAQEAREPHSAEAAGDAKAPHHTNEAKDAKNDNDEKGMEGKDAEGPQAAKEAAASSEAGTRPADSKPGQAAATAPASTQPSTAPSATLPSQTTPAAPLMPQPEAPEVPSPTRAAADAAMPSIIPFRQTASPPPQKAKTGKNKIVMPGSALEIFAASPISKMQPEVDSVETTSDSMKEPEKDKKCHLKTRLGYQPIHRVLIDNWQSGLTVAMVSVPLSISLGIASVSGGDPAAPLMGVSTAFWGGLCASLFSSSDFNIIGPAGALSGMLSSATIKFGGAGVLPYLSLLSSAIICLIYLLGLQKYLLLMPTAVFEGFTLAVAFIIGLGQLEMALDLRPDGHKSEHFYENVLRSIQALDGYSLAPAILFFVVTALLLTLVKYASKIRGKSIPWTVLLPLLTILLGYLSDKDMLGGIILPTLKDKYGTLQARIVEVPSVPLADFAAGDVFGLIRNAFGIAFVAILETLISAKIAEQRMNYPFDSSRETFGLMVCHAVCGVVGALPPTGVFVRTSLNVQLGATHRLSQMINAIAVFLIFVVAMPVFSYLPQAAVAALLVFASIRMAPVHYIAKLWRTDKKSCFLLVLTSLICIFVDPVYGLIVGMVVALLRNAAETARAESRVTLDKAEMAVSDTGTPLSSQHGALSHWATSSFDDAANLAVKPSPLTRIKQLIERFACGKPPVEHSNALHRHKTFQGFKTVLYEPMGSVTFLCASKHLSRLQALLDKKPTRLIISLEHVTRIDIDGSDNLAKAVKEIKDAECDVRLVVPELLLQGVILQKALWVDQLRTEGRIYNTVADAKLAGADCEI
ncbi:yvdB [Symbiodinium necroappetens]|uniref:YvdB protein n=1 Tax=Symbiodinium necroappetens TaxID=1628268 RepID=A0A812Q8J1_9DINO|nr:yvdB [Symbiodinium necroappetens]